MAAGLDAPRCAVNLSARQFSSESLLDDVRASLKRSGLSADALEVEITESVLMSDPDRANLTLQELHELGVHIAIDDFGTSYSSLAYLKRLPAHTVKLDRSFVSGLPADRDDAAITQAVIALSHSLAMQVVAEGVETDAQLDFPRRLGCDQAGLPDWPADARGAARAAAAGTAHTGQPGSLSMNIARRLRVTQSGTHLAPPRCAAIAH